MSSSPITQKKKKPIIGISLDYIHPESELCQLEGFKYSRYPWYALKGHYISAVLGSGGLPMMIPSSIENIKEYLNVVDGIVIPGACFDVDPKFYGEEINHPSVSINAHRTAFEWALIEETLKRDIPLLGICGGQQLLNVFLGGTLIQHIPAHAPSEVNHKPSISPTEMAHRIDISPQTLLSNILGEISELFVNSVHHQGIKTLGKGLRVNATAPDKMIEGFELPGYRFVMGFQWHPEFFVSHGDKLIFDAFICAALSDDGQKLS